MIYRIKHQPGGGGGGGGGGEIMKHGFWKEIFRFLSLQQIYLLLHFETYVPLSNFTLSNRMIYFLACFTICSNLNTLRELVP